MLYVFLITIAAMMYISYRTYQDVLSPSFLYCLMWLVSGIGLLISGYPHHNDSYSYLVFIAGAILFQVGYGLIPQKQPSRKKPSQAITYRLNSKVFLFLLAAEVLFTLVYLALLVVFIRSNFLYNLFTSFYANKSSFAGLLVFGYVKKIINAVTIALICLSGHIQKEDQRVFSRILMGQVVIGILCGLTEFTRNGILMALLPMIMAYFISRARPSKKSLGLIAGFGVLFLLVFLYVAVSKNTVSMEAYGFLETMQQQLRVYLASPMAAFTRVMDQGGWPLQYGGNTFRFLIAIADRIFHTDYANPLVQAFTAVGTDTTNVYTFYQFYMQDFGVLYALLVQFVLGLGYALIYRNAAEGKMFFRYLYALSIYPLVMQFFNDQYVSLLSTWMQYLVYGLLLFRTDLFFQKDAAADPEAEEKTSAKPLKTRQALTK